MEPTYLLPVFKTSDMNCCFYRWHLRRVHQSTARQLGMYVLTICEPALENRPQCKVTNVAISTSVALYSLCLCQLVFQATLCVRALLPLYITKTVLIPLLWSTAITGWSPPNHIKEKTIFITGERCIPELALVY